MHRLPRVAPDKSGDVTPETGEIFLPSLVSRICFFPECGAKGSRLTLRGSGGRARPVVSKFATVRNRSQPSAVER